jgi:hypothetical protein
VFICLYQGSYLFSPGDRTFDAWGLVDQMNVHCTTIMTEARDVLPSSKEENKENIDAKKELGASKLETKTMVRNSHCLVQYYIALAQISNSKSSLNIAGRGKSPGFQRMQHTCKSKR